MTQVLRFEDIEIGRRRDRLSYRLTPGDIRKYLDAVQDDNPVYREESPSGLPIAPSTICARDIFRLPLMQTFWDGIELCEPPEDRRAFLHAKHEIDYINPPRSGMKINVEGFIADKYIERGRYWVVVETVTRAENGLEFLRCRGTFTWLADEKLAEESTRIRESVSNIPTGKEIQSLKKLVTLEAGKLFSGWPEQKNYHTDEKIAQDFGFPSIIMQAFMGVAYLSEMCYGFFGDSWYRGGKLTAKFISTVLLPICLTARGVVKEGASDKSKMVSGLDVWLEDEEGGKVQVGEASCLFES